MSFGAFSSSRTVLMMSDEFLSVYDLSSKGVRLLESVPWGADDFVRHIAKVISRDGGGKSVLILNDMVEQHYRKERVARLGVNVVDKASMLRRKLKAAFPSYPVRAAMMLKEKLPRTDKQAAADIYIFAAVANTDQLAKTSEAASLSLASIAGFALLPVESADMVSQLSAKLTPKNKKKPVWTVFIGQHKNGSLRQVVTKNGELALTRMSPMVDKDDAPQVWATELHQEFKSTMSYLSRFGYDTADGLDVIVISNAGAGEILGGMIQEECTLHIMTAGEAANTLGLRTGRQENGRYADVLHVAWAGRKARLALPMKVAQIEAVSAPRKVAVFAGAAMVAAAAFLGYQCFSTMSVLDGISSDVQRVTSDKAQLDLQYTKEVERLNAMGFDVQLVQSSILVRDEFEKNKIDLLGLVEQASKALGKDLRIDNISIQRPSGNPVEQAIDAVLSSQPPLYEAKLQMTYPSTADVDKGDKEVSDLRDRLAKLMPGNTVKVTKLLKDYEYTEGLVVEAGDVQGNTQAQDFVAEILIEGLSSSEVSQAAGQAEAQNQPQAQGENP